MEISSKSDRKRNMRNIYGFFLGTFCIMYLPKRKGCLRIQLETIPDNFHPSSTFGLLFFPLRLIPVQLIEHHNKCRHQIQVLVHPAGFQNTFWNIPFIGRSLQASTNKMSSFLSALTDTEAITYAFA